MVGASAPVFGHVHACGAQLPIDTMQSVDRLLLRNVFKEF